MITQEILKELLNYSPETGDFSWRVRRGSAGVGKIAGRINNDGYIGIGINDKKYQAHRLVFLYMEGKFPDKETDHINKDRKDNRWANLRHATRRQNARNRSLPSTNKSGKIGVFYRKDIGKWVAFISSNENKYITLGKYKSFQAACFMRISAELKYGYDSGHGKETTSSYSR